MLMHISKRLLPVWPSKNCQTDRASLHVPEEYFPNPLSLPSIIGVNGVEQQIEEKWNSEENRAFIESAHRLKQALEGVK